jgi:hypothetical protein
MGRSGSVEDAAPGDIDQHHEPIVTLTGSGSAVPKAS